MNIMLSAEAHMRLTILEKNARKMYTGKKISKSGIIEQLIMDTCDPVEKIRQEQKKHQQEIMRLEALKESLTEQK